MINEHERTTIQKHSTYIYTTFTFKRYQIQKNKTKV